MKYVEFFWSIITIAILILFLVRWWRMTSDIRDIKLYLSRMAKPQLNPADEPEAEVDADNDLLEPFKKKMKAQQCIVMVLADSTLEVWDRATWEEHLLMGKGGFFKLMYKNY